MIRQFDVHGSHCSAFFYMLGTFESADDCVELFQQIIDALDTGQKTFELPQFLPPTVPEAAGQKGRSGGFL